MNILVVEPGKQPYAKEISGDLDSLQQTVGGYIQAIYPFDDSVALVESPDQRLWRHQGDVLPLRLGRG